MMVELEPHVHLQKEVGAGGFVSSTLSGLLQCLELTARVDDNKKIG